MERRKRVCEKRSCYMSNELKKKRVAEPRPHPPDCLNKRYWDDVRAGRVPEPSWASPKTENISKFSVRSKSGKRESLNSEFRSINTSTTNSFMPSFNHPELFPTHFPFAPLPILPFINPMLSLPHIPSTSMRNFSLPSPSLNLNLVSSQNSAKVPTTSYLPPSSTQTSSDDQLDKILNDHFLKNQQSNKSKIPSSENSKICILPIPIPIPLVLPLSTDFIFKNFGLKNNCKK